MDEKIIRIVAARLRRFGGEPINQEKLVIIRDDVYKATRTNKFAPFSNVKKWVKAARAYMKKAQKPAAKPSKPTKGKSSAKKAPVAPNAISALQPMSGWSWPCQRLSKKMAVGLNTVTTNLWVQSN